MSVTRDAVLDCLSRISLPDGGTLLSRDLVRALDVEGGMVRFVIEAADAAEARALAGLRDAAEAAVRAIPGVTGTSIVLTAHGPAAKPAPSLKIGGHPTPQAGPQPIAGSGAFSPWARARAASASRPWRRTSPSHWRERAARSVCSTPTSMGPRRPG